jgi:hypothetical protein
MTAFKQCELHLFSVPKNGGVKSSSETIHSRSVGVKSIYQTTKQVVDRLGLENDYLLRKARSNGGAYRSDRYIAVPAGHNKWELFQRCKA